MAVLEQEPFWPGSQYMGPLFPGRPLLRDQKVPVVGSPAWAVFYGARLEHGRSTGVDSKKRNE